MSRGDAVLEALALAGMPGGRSRLHLGGRLGGGHDDELTHGAEVDGAVRVLGADVPAVLAGRQACPGRAHGGAGGHVGLLVDELAGQHLDGDGVGPEGLGPRLDAELGVGHLELLVLRLQGRIIGVVVLQGRRVGPGEHPLPLVVEVQQAQVSQAALREALVVEENLRDLTVVDPVPVVVEPVDAGEGVVVVTREHQGDVRVGRHDLVVDPLRDRSEAAGRQHVLVEVEDRGALGVLGQHLVHPGDLLVAGPPPLVQHDEVHAVDRDEVVVAPVVLVRPAVPGVAVEPLRAEERAVGPVVLKGVPHVVVAGQDSIRQTRFVEHPVGVVGALPLLRLVPLVHDVARVEDVGQVEPLARLEEVLVDRELMLVPGLVVVLRVRLPAEGEVVLGAGHVLRVAAGHRGLAGAQVGVGEALRVLDEQLDAAVAHVVCDVDEALERELRRVVPGRQGAVELLPATGGGVQHREDHLGVRIGAAVPGDAHLPLGGDVVDGDLEELVRECVVRAHDVLTAVVGAHQLERRGVGHDLAVPLGGRGHGGLTGPHVEALLARSDLPARVEVDVERIAAGVRDGRGQLHVRAVDGCAVRR